MDKKLKLWKSVRKFIFIGWILWAISIICSQFIVLSDGFDWVIDYFMGFVIVWPFLFFVLLLLTYYETNQIYDKEYNKDKKQDQGKIKINFIEKLRVLVILMNVILFFWMIIPKSSSMYCFNCYYWARYAKILLLVGNIYLLSGPEKINKWSSIFRKRVKNN